MRPQVPSAHFCRPCCGARAQRGHCMGTACMFGQIYQIRIIPMQNEAMMLHSAHMLGAGGGGLLSFHPRKKLR